MKWEKVRLKDICESIADGDHQPPPKSINGIPFVTIANITDNKIDFSKSMFVSNDYYENLDQKRRAQKDDILYSVVGTFGIPVFIKEYKPFVFQWHIAILRPNKNNIDAKFLYYMMLSKNFYMKADSVAIGAAQRTITLNSLRNIEVDVPKIETQRRIADILSTYDDLIENNQKQIKLLEEAVQRLYKEWFVDLRFPGYEQTKIIDGVPEGWEKVCLKAYCDIKSGYAFKSKDWNKSGCGVIKIKDISNKFVDYSDCDFVPKDIAEKAANYYLNQGDLVIAMTGATIGKIGICTKEGYYANQRVGKVFLGNKPKEKLPYAYCILSQKSTMDFILNNSSASSAQPNISGDKICDIKIVYNEVYVMRFNKKMKSVFEKMILLKEQNEMLSVIRDNLLPKLMSGEIEV